LNDTATRHAAITGEDIAHLVVPEREVRGCQMLISGLPARSVIHVAIRRRQAMATDCNEQPVIIKLQSAQIEDARGQ
jgi:hypothetical protein